MDIKVRELTEVEPKSQQEIEKELLDKHEEKQNQVEQPTESSTDNIKVEETTSEPEVKEETTEKEVVNEEKKEAQEKNPEIEFPEIEDKDVLSYIDKRYGKQITSMDELLTEREKAEELPEDVAAYFKYKKETGRGINDYAKLQRDFSDLGPDALLREFYSITEEGLDAEDIDMMMDDFRYDEDVDEPTQIKKVKLAKKKEIAKAKKFFRNQQELYKQPLESRESSGTVDEEYVAYRQSLEDAKAQQQENEYRSQWFVKKTDEVFNDDFKGFKFDIDDKSLVFSPGNASELKKAQQTAMNFVQKFLDEKGFIKDATGYHKALAVAMNPERFAKFFYEQGKSSATEDVIRKTKNIDMSERKAPEVLSKGGFKVKAVSPSSGRGLKIKSLKRS